MSFQLNVKVSVLVSKGYVVEVLEKNRNKIVIGVLFDIVGEILFFCYLKILWMEKQSRIFSGYFFFVFCILRGFMLEKVLFFF